MFDLRFVSKLQSFELLPEMQSAHGYLSLTQKRKYIHASATVGMQCTFSTSGVVTAAYILQLLFRNDPKSGEKGSSHFHVHRCILSLTTSNIYIFFLLFQ